MACFFMLEPPGTPEVSALDMVRAGILKAPFLFGRAPVARLLEAKAWYERQEREVMAARGLPPGPDGP